jgi:hypothetical protein
VSGATSAKKQFLVMGQTADEILTTIDKLTVR